MDRRHHIRQWTAIGAAAASVLLVAASLVVSQGPGDADAAASRVERLVSRRLARLDAHVAEAAAIPRDRLVSIRLPDDMVIYRYLGDTLQSWCNQFPLANDDIRGADMVIQRLTSFRSNPRSPLSEVTEAPSYVNYGPKWYLVQARRDGDALLISGLEIVNELDESSFNGVNPRLRLGDRFSIQPLTGSGSTVSVGGLPLFKVASEISVGHSSNSILVWSALVLFLIGAMLFLSCRRTWRRYWAVIAVIVAAMTGAFLYGMRAPGVLRLFSPILYADGPFLYSLGAVVLLNLLITFLVLATYMIRWTLYDFIRERRTGVRLAVGTVAAFLMAVGICAYIHWTFKSIVMNSGITLELYKIDTLSAYTALVYVSYLSLAMTLPVLVQMMAPAARAWSGLRYDAFSTTGRIVFAAVCALYFVLASSLLGFRKEQNRVAVWSNRLAMDRDISLEIQLRSVEGAIAADPLVAALSFLDNRAGDIQNRLIDTYMARIAQDYDISVYVMNGGTVNPELNAMFGDRIAGGTQIADRSLFYYSRDVGGHARYSGSFMYYSAQYGVSNILVGVESKSNREDRGYLSLLGISEPGRVLVPGNYSYAKYVSDKLIAYKGDYAYPTVMDGSLRRVLEGHPSLSGYAHFINNVADDECIVISRPKIEAMSYIVEAFLFGLLAFFLLSAVTLRRRRRRSVTAERQYYKSRINAVLLGALVLTLVAMAGFSVYFVYRRNDADMKTIMSSKITSIQSMLQSRARFAETYQDVRTQEMSSVIEEIGTTLKSDVTLYTPSGKAFLTSTPEIFDRMIIGQRINQEALDNIVNGHRRYYIHREKIASHRFWSLYAPVSNGAGELLAIASSPYTDRNYDLEREALTHVITIITAFLLLLIIARFVTTAIVARMFKPLTEMSRKMDAADLDNLQYIRYERDDEISTLVAAYNRMVSDLSDSSHKLAQAERDKAWSGMARQVAHEIKNPLTPIKLKLQMLIRMKESGNPEWEEKFDEVARVVLEHIDILADTANQFSTFAHLYSEEPVRFDIDALLREEVMMFEGRPGIGISYIGFGGAEVLGPKPQLTRVAVNLITNAVQAVEERQAAEAEAGREPGPGRIVVSLRNSVKDDGCYDIVFEDNGPGVDEENRDKLFTPNFTTKTRGTGLGLAICRSIVERCKGEIEYSRSFTLGGACFTIRYPKLK